MARIVEVELDATSEAALRLLRSRNSSDAEAVRAALIVAADIARHEPSGDTRHREGSGRTDLGDEDTLQGLA